MSSTSSSSEDGGGGGAARRGGAYEGPSTSRRRRSVNEVWPEPFLEALAAQVAIDARSGGRLSVAPALVNIFRVRAPSLSLSLVRRMELNLFVITSAVS
ncbi:hypothetical protein NL676_017746 [Syzygium grande]|nr:hypothetical protein NL676_017746 [Syzygium grande]